jgi:type VI secretion system secreted protein VgrG
VGQVYFGEVGHFYIGANTYVQINGNGIINGSSGPIVEKTPKWSKQGADAQMPSFPPFGTGKATDDYSHSL